MARPILCGLAFTLTGATPPGDHVGLVQQSLQKVSLSEEPNLEQGVLSVLGGVVNMMKLDNLLREKILTFEPREQEEEGSAAPELHAEEAHEAHLVQPAEAPAEAPAVAPAVAEAVAPAAEAAAEAPAVAPAELSAKESSLVGTGCSLGDHSRMNVSITALGRLALEKGPAVLQQALPASCSRIFGVGVNFTAFDGCIQQFFEVGPSCSACQVNLLKGLVGTNLFHLGCTPKCANILAKCTNKEQQGPNKECLAALGNCMDCGLPAWKEHTRCVGGLPNRQQGLQVLDGLVMALKSGDIAEPGTFETILQRAASSDLQ